MTLAVEHHVKSQFWPLISEMHGKECISRKETVPENSHNNRINIHEQKYSSTGRALIG